MPNLNRPEGCPGKYDVLYMVCKEECPDKPCQSSLMDSITAEQCEEIEHKVYWLLETANKSAAALCLCLSSLRANRAHIKKDFQTFEGYCESLFGLKKTQSNKYAAIGDTFGKWLLEDETLGEAGVNKLSDLLRAHKSGQLLEHDVPEYLHKAKTLKAEDWELELNELNGREPKPECDHLPGDMMFFKLTVCKCGKALKKERMD